MTSKQYQRGECEFKTADEKEVSRETRQRVVTLGKPEEDKPDREGIEDKLEGFEDNQKVDNLVEGVADNQKVDNLAAGVVDNLVAGVADNQKVGNLVEDNQSRVELLDQSVTLPEAEAPPLAVDRTYHLSCPFPPCVVSAYKRKPCSKPCRLNKRAAEKLQKAHQCRRYMQRWRICKPLG